MASSKAAVRKASRKRKASPLNLEEYRQGNESDKHWVVRRQFVSKHVEEYRARNSVDQLLALSMVWANHVFMGCRYGPELMQKVQSMAEGIDIGEVPSFELVPGAEKKKRPSSSDDKEAPVKKLPVSKFGPRPRFEPVHFVSSSGTEEKQSRKGERDSPGQTDFEHSPESNSSRPAHGRQGPSFQNAKPYVFDAWADGDDKDVGSNACGLGFGSRSGSAGFMLKTQQDYCAKLEAHRSRRPEASRGSVSESAEAGGPAGSRDSRRGLGFGNQDSAAAARAADSPGDGSLAHQSGDLASALEKTQKLVARVASAMAATYKDPTSMSGPDTPNYNFILSRSIQACKTNPEYIYVNLKEIAPGDLPKNRKVPSDGYACELRCKRVYLATGYSGSKNGARDRASEQAVKLFLRPVEVRVIQRKFRRTYVSDLVVCQRHLPTPHFPPALCNPEDTPPPSSRGQYEPDPRKHWTEFVIVENAHDAICILNNSAAFNRMKIDYKFEVIPNTSSWQCSVYLQDELVAQAAGNKKTSKHAAAEEALRKLRLNQASRQQQQQFPQGNHGSEFPGGRFGQHGRRKHLSELVILENSDNAICILNDTAQFNKVSADYKFVVLADHRWKCEVYLEGQFVAAGIGPKKAVKHIAAEEALAKLRQTQAVVKSNLRKEGNEDAISRKQILRLSGEEAQKQEIKEDNIGNQLLRKMGWKGGGLGREGEGITEPIKVKEQFTREGLGLDVDRGGNQLNKRDIEEIIRNYASSDRQDDLRFSSELNNEERKQIHQMAQKYGLRSKSYGQAMQRFLVVSRKVQKEQLIGQLFQEGQVGRYELVKPQASH
uniref:NFKB repressing factor n=1 Tax=Lepisosteus oculatus TaxID=7918 RepID=W5NDN4_LEPOC|nr:PREDICTED: NF-kappa-B-repressing factor isoform X1 [Lepisosteus oculatus]